MSWTPELLFDDQTVIVVGGGASLAGFDFGRLKGRRIIAVNAAGYDVPFADVLFFFDTRFFFEHRLMVDGWAGLVVTASVPAERLSALKCVEIAERAPLSRGKAPLKRGRTSGHCALILAIAMGACRVVLLGFDCKAIGSRTHYHTRYCEEHREIYATDFLPAWAGYCAEARALGCEILNAGPDSAITEFPFVLLDQILGEAKP